jgi:hypothetical protein
MCNVGGINNRHRQRNCFLDDPAPHFGMLHEQKILFLKLDEVVNLGESPRGLEKVGRLIKFWKEQSCRF